MRTFLSDLIFFSNLLRSDRLLGSSTGNTKEREREREGEVLLTIKKRLEVGKYNALSRGEGG